MAGLYIHVPFCKQRCTYCDFYFVTTRKTHGPFIEALIAEIEYWGQRYGHREPIDTIYLGGGTPSLLSVDHINRLFETISSVFDTSHTSEVTFELNPDDADEPYLKSLSQTQVNRLSIGIQSFDSQLLKWMNRAHSSEQAYRIIEMARSQLFTNFSVDLIFGIPGQPLDVWRHTLDTVCDQEVPHLSTYSLTIEPSTPLSKRVHRGLEQPVTDETMAQFYAGTLRHLKKRGYEQYEVSSFSLTGFRSQHNQSYWTHQNYLGFGPSSHSFWREPDKQAMRWYNVRNLKAYESWQESNQPPIAHSENLTENQLLNEYIMLRLRTKDGMNLRHLKDQYGYDLEDTHRDTLSRLESEKLIHWTIGHSLALSEHGFLVCDAVTRKLLIEP